MPQEKIIIKFEAQDKGLLAALNKLSTVQAKLAGSQAKVTKASKNEKQALLQVARAQQDAAATARDLERLTEKEAMAKKKLTVAIKKVNTAAASLTAKLKAQNVTWKQLGVSNEILKKGYKGNRIALERMRMAMAKATKEGLLAVRNNRLLANSFATLRSKLLLVSFGAMLVERAFVSLVKSYGRQEAADKKLQVGLGNVAGTTKGVTQRLIDYSAALQQTTAFGDEMITTGMVQFTTFGLNEKAIKALTPQVLNVARAIQTVSGTMPDLNSLFIAFGKATTTGIGTLTRYGVVLTKAERAQLGSMDANESAVKIAEILKRQYGGLAEAYAKTTSGMLEAAAAARGDAAEALGEFLAPAVLAVSKGLKFMFEAMTVERIKAYATAIGLAAAGTLLYKGVLIGTTGVLKKAAVAQAFLNKVIRKNPFLLIASVAAIAVGALLDYFDVFEDKEAVMTDAEKKMAKFNTALEEDRILAEELIKAQESSVVSLQKQLKLLDAKTKVEKMLINLGHIASPLEETIINQIVEKTAAIEAEKDALKELEKARSDAMKQSEIDFNAAVKAQELAISTEEKAQQQLEKMFPTLEQYSAEISKKMFIERANQEVLRQWIAANQELAASLRIETDATKEAREATEEYNDAFEAALGTWKKRIADAKAYATALDKLKIVEMEHAALADGQIDSSEKLAINAKKRIQAEKALTAARSTKDVSGEAAALSNINSLISERAGIIKGVADAEQSALDAREKGVQAVIKQFDAEASLALVLKEKQLLLDGEIDRADELILLNMKMAEAEIKLAQAQNLGDIDAEIAALAAINSLRQEGIDLTNTELGQFVTKLNYLNEVNAAISGATSLFLQNVNEQMQIDVAATKQTSEYKRAMARGDKDAMEKLEKDAKNKHHSSLVAAFRMEQVSSIANIIMSFAQAHAKAFATMPLPAALASMPLLTALAAVQIGLVAAQAPPAKFAHGGMIGGRRHSQGGTMIEAEAGEFVMRREAVAKLGVPFMDVINKGDKEVVRERIERFEKGGLVQEYHNSVKEIYEKGGLVTNSITEIFKEGGLISNTIYREGGLITNNTIERFKEGGLIGSPPINISNILPTSTLPPAAEPVQITVNVSGNVLTQDFVEGELAENIKEAIRRGTDFGIS